MAKRAMFQNVQSNGLDKWFKQNGSILGASEKMVPLQSVAVQNKKRTRKEVSKMRASSQSETDDRRAEKICCCRKRAAGNTGPKPTNVKTFAKEKKMGD